MKIFTFILFFFLTSCQDQQEKYYGFLEGRYAYLSCEFSGNLTDLFVKRGESVRKGQSLFKIDDRQEQINIKILSQDIEKAQINLNYAQKDVNLDTINLDRKIILNNTKLASDADVDRARIQLNASRDKFELAQKDLTEADSNYRLELLKQSKKLISAPHNGFIADNFYSTGEFVNAASSVISLLPEDQMMAVFFVSYKKVQNLKKGMVVNIECANCQTNLKGIISYIQSSPEFTPPNIYSSNFPEELVFRIEAELSYTDAYKLNAGQPIEITFR